MWQVVFATGLPKVNVASPADALELMTAIYGPVFRRGLIFYCDTADGWFHPLGHVLYVGSTLESEQQWQQF